MADEQELTPEEKLLKVIQKGESKPETETAEARSPASGSTTPDPSAVVAGLPPLGNSLRFVNRIAAAAAVLFVLLAGYETYRNIPDEAFAYPPDELPLRSSLAAIAPASLSDTLDMFARRRVFGQPPPPPATITNITPTNIINLIGWRAYARENLSLMGMSNVKRIENGVEQIQREAIVMDNKVKRMQFLTEGKTLIIAEQDVSVSRVGDSFVELKLGEEVLTIE